MENLFKRGSLVNLDKKKGIIPDHDSIIKFWKD